MVIGKEDLEGRLGDLKQQHRSYVESVKGQNDQYKAELDRLVGQLREIGNVKPSREQIRQERELRESVSRADDDRFYYKVIVGQGEKRGGKRIILRRSFNSSSNDVRFPYEEFRQRHSEVIDYIANNKEPHVIISDRNFTNVSILSREAALAHEVEFNRNLGKIRGDNSSTIRDLESSIGGIKEDMAKLLKEYRAERDRYKIHSAYMNGSLEANSEESQIRKGVLSYIEDRPFYSLWRGNSTLFLYQDGKLHYLFSSRRDTPLEIRCVETNKVFNSGRLGLATSLLRFSSGDYTDRMAYPLFEEQSRIAEEIFDKVRRGIRILPRNEVPEGYIEVDKPSEDMTPAEIRYRHWGQEYLAEYEPVEVVQGELLGGGGSYKAFKFGNGKTVVEFDQEERATYLFATATFENLRNWKRSEILSERPEGFDGRIFHLGQDVWKAAVDNYLRS